MPLAIFGIDNTALNLAVTLVILMLVAIWIALIVFTFTDARRRISDPFLVGCATAASFFPFVGTLVYSILRPPEFLDDIRERETDIQEAEVRLRHLQHNSCHKCGSPVESDFIRCPACRTRLKEPCPTCSKPVGLNWKVCPYCETTLIAPKRSSRSSSKRPKSDSRSRSSKPAQSSSSSSSKAPAKTEAKSSRNEQPTRRVRKPAADEAAEKPRTSRSSRRKVSVGDDEPSDPINRGEN
ncbi:MAG: zinc ribbon domain-containing protein [Solirubrobacterales bacterium]|nr:zinc ribbon domain-containing protein [Solirubrobacterales bacterium]